MRIGIDARELLGHPTGVGRYLSELLTEWREDPGAAAHDLVLLSPAPLPAEYLRPGTGARVRATTLPGGRGSLWEQWTLPRAMRRLGLDVLFAPAYSAPLLAPVPAVVSIHDVSFAAHPEWFRPREGWRRRTIVRRAARRARTVLTLSRFSRDEIVRHLGVDAAKVRIVPPGVRPRVARPAGQAGAATPGDGPAVLFVGSVFNRRHVPTLMRAVSRLADELPGIRLDVVGDHRTYPPLDLEAERRACANADRIALRRYVPDAELLALYAAADAFVFLSEYEGFGLTPLEALACGVPPILLDTAVAREAFEEAAVYVPLDEAAVAAAIRGVCHDGARRARLREAGIRLLDRYTWGRAARETLAAIVEAGNESR
jgi:glycosyltransferase involved in cell wall biosynthesis